MPHVGGMCKQGFMPARLPLKGVLPHGDVSTGAEAALASRGGKGRNTVCVLRALKLAFPQSVIAARKRKPTGLVSRCFWGFPDVPIFGVSGTFPNPGETE